MKVGKMPDFALAKSGIFRPTRMLYFPHRMRHRIQLFIFIFASLAFAGLLAFLTLGHPIPILQPHGLIASKERTLMINAVLLMLIVVIPVFILAFYFAWHYRAGNTSATYTPDWEHAKMDELIWWAIPFEIILVLGALTWGSTHDLDPYKPLESEVAPIEIQVVALPSRWLFIYPNEHIATVNFVQFPVDTPVNFKITADAPMNSFWIPQLGGQIYAMTGMQTPLHLIADKVGDYRGSSANFSGPHFAGMVFTAQVRSEEDFSKWLEGVQNSSSTLNDYEYEVLKKPRSDNPVQYYGGVQDGMFDSIIHKFMMPEMDEVGSEHSHSMDGMEMHTH